MTRIIAFEPSYNAKHRAILRALADSISGAEVRPLEKYEPCDIAIVFGSYKKSYKPTWPKKEILKRHTGRNLLMVESAFVKRGEYWQIGWGGYAGWADFNIPDDCPMDRWESFGIKSKPWTDRRGPVVVCGQVPWDTQVQGVDHKAWCRESIEKLHDAGYEVWFRPHPRIGDPKRYGVTGVHIDTQKMKHTVAQVSAAVTWNSTSAVDFALAGVPVIACDEGSIARPIAGHSIETLINGKIPRRSRKQWLAGLGYSQWNLEEIKEGMPWRHLNQSR